MHVMIYDPDGNLVAETTGVKKRNPQTRTLEMQVPEMEIANAQLWDTESPKLYKAVAQLLREDGSVADEYAEHFGHYHSNQQVWL